MDDEEASYQKTGNNRDYYCCCNYYYHHHHNRYCCRYYQSNNRCKKKFQLLLVNRLRGWHAPGETFDPVLSKVGNAVQVGRKYSQGVTRGDEESLVT